MPPGFPEWHYAFMAAWVAVGVIFWAFFRFNRNARLKRVLYPLVVVATGAAFFAYVAAVFGLVSVAVAPFILLIVVVNLRLTRFCDACGASVYAKNSFSRPRACTRCSAKLDP